MKENAYVMLKNKQGELAFCENEIGAIGNYMQNGFEEVGTLITAKRLIELKIMFSVRN